MRLVLDLDPSAIEFVEPLSPGANPFLLSVGSLHLAVRAGHLQGIGSSESPSVDVKLDNSGRRAGRIIGRPLRVRATLYDGADVYFTGIVEDATFGPIIGLTIEA